MNREIKFRAYLINKNKIVSVEAVYWGGRGYGKQLLSIDTFHEKNVSYSEINLMQYTGLKDKNGKEIYEGDIVTDAVARTWLIQYSDKLCSFVFNWIKNKSITNQILALPNFISAQLPFTREGNIYENPELIGGNK